MSEHEAEMGDLRSEFQELLQADAGKLSQMSKLLASVQSAQEERKSLTTQLTEAHSLSEARSPNAGCCTVRCESTAKVPAKCKLKYYSISECAALSRVLSGRLGHAVVAGDLEKGMLTSCSILAYPN